MAIRSAAIYIPGILAAEWIGDVGLAWLIGALSAIIYAAWEGVRWPT